MSEREREIRRWKETDIGIIGTAAQRSNIMIIKSVSLTLPCDIRASIQVLPRRRLTSKSSNIATRKKHSV